MQAGIGALVVMGLMVARTAAEPCIQYEPTEVQLEGRVVRETFPGPPNHESVEAGDTPEVVWILTLDRPVCVDASRTDEENPKEADVTRVQLVLEPWQYDKYKAFVGHQAWVQGTLFHATTGHHHEAILMSVRRWGRPLKQ